MGKIPPRLCKTGLSESIFSDAIENSPLYHA